ncbi:MAG: hypothetical protein K6F58_00830 [Bacteroidales bacterium]|nr:hypothetical protein [Bacteroidales bacterium]
MTLKHLLLWTLPVLTGCLLFACKSDIESAEKAQPGKDGFVLRAEMPDASTRTALGAKNGDAYPVVWKQGDKVSVNGTLSNAVAAGDDGEKLVDFTFPSTPSGSVFKVLYPGTASENVIVLPATQTYVAGSFDPAAAASYGNAVENGGVYSVSLDNFCGIINFQLNGSATLTKIELDALGGEKLYGSFTMTTNGSGFTGAFTGGTAGTLTYSFGDGLTLTGANTQVYIAVPAQTYSDQGMEARIYDNTGAFMTLLFWTSGKTLGKNVVEFPAKEYIAKRTENIFEIGGLTAEAGGEPTATPPGITVATFNVMRLDDDNRPAAATAGDSNGKIARPANAIVKNCADMQEALGKAIYNTAADLIGFNEIGDDMYESGQTYSLEDIAAAQGASYTWKLNFPGSESGNYHYCNGFAYKSSVLTLNESGKVWLRYNSESYSANSASDSGDPNRFVVWAKFTHKVSSKVFYFFVTQLPTYGQDGGSGTSNTNMSGGVNAFAAAKAGAYPQILVGDMNSAPGHSSEAGYNKLKLYWTDAYEAVSAAGNLASYYTTYSGTQSGTGDTFHYSMLQFTKNHGERRIDHIMTHGDCTATSYRTIRNTYVFDPDAEAEDDEVVCSPSDHLPVVSYITLD